MARTLVCDRCGVTERANLTLNWRWFKRKNLRRLTRYRPPNGWGEYDEGPQRDDFDICPTCAESFIKWLEGGASWN